MLCAEHLLEYVDMCLNPQNAGPYDVVFCFVQGCRYCGATRRDPNLENCPWGFSTLLLPPWGSCSGRAICPYPKALNLQP